jgi:putative ATP-dependent endonuclease of the OLD family
MVFNKIIVDNYKCFRHFQLDLQNSLALVVGDNEAGKSTLLEAINLCLTAQLNGRSLAYEMSPYLFNREAVMDYLQSLRRGEKVLPPSITIELYFKSSPEFADLKGSINSLGMNVPGVRLSIEFDEDYGDEYGNYIKDPTVVRSVPVEYYSFRWYSFANGTITKRSLQTNVTFIDTTVIRLQYGSDYYIQKIIDDALEPKEKAEIAIAYRMLKEKFASQDALSKINAQLRTQTGRISDKELQISIDISQKAGWETSMTSYLDDVPFQNIGKGDQSILKMLIAPDRRASESHVILIEEPENHLSYSTMNHLIGKIEEKCKAKQVLIATHSTFVLNKLGVDKVILLSAGANALSLKDLPPETLEYFRKLPGFDTLRLIIAKYPVLVEGPSDELIVQKAYLSKTGHLPIQDGIDVISVRSLSFKRFLSIAVLLNKRVAVVADNDGDYQTNVESRYAEFLGKPNIIFHYDKDDNFRTLEPQIIRANGIEVLNRVFSKSFETVDELLKYMLANKTDCALEILDSDEHIEIPSYIMSLFDE